jgi:CRP-like cAMP-binding protein
MESEIIKYMSGYIPVSKELEEAIIKSNFIKFFKKGTLLIKEGKLSAECFFILKGCVRSYYIKDGEEKTTEFYTEEQAIPSNLSGEKKASNYFLECVEDVIAAVSNPALEAEMYQKFPGLESLTRVMNETIMVNYIETFAEFKMSSPEERYLNLLKTRPDLIQRVPQHQIASYLGIKPESLSRIRKRIINNH